MLCLKEIWPAETTQVEGNKDALDSPFLASDDPDMQDIMVSTQLLLCFMEIRSGGHFWQSSRQVRTSF